jgi:hypothetical protein
MRKLIAIAAVSAVALAAPGSAGAGQDKKKYVGGFEPTGDMSFVLKKANNGKKIFNFKWVGFPLDCRGTPETSSSKLLFAVEVENREFKTRAVDDENDPGALLKLKGELKGMTLAEGTMSIEGKNVPVDGGGRKKCDSGILDWTASTLAGR